MSLAPGSTPRLARHARVRWDAREGKYLLLSPERGLLLSESAAAIVKLCDGAHTVEGIVAALVARFGPEARKAIERDTLALLDELRNRGLLDRVQ
jgi:pyrroloquinoline quinone biosynthesis protein D